MRLSFGFFKSDAKTFMIQSLSFQFLYRDRFIIVNSCNIFSFTCKLAFQNSFDTKEQDIHCHLWIWPRCRRADLLYPLPLSRLSFRLLSLTIHPPGRREYLEKKDIDHNKILKLLFVICQTLHEQSIELRSNLIPDKLTCQRSFWTFMPSFMNERMFVQKA